MIDHARTNAVTAPCRIGIVLFTNVEVLDFAGPFEVFSVASRVALRDGDSAKAPFEVVTIAREQEVVARHGLRVVPDHTFETCPPLDVILIPGGVVDAPLADEGTLRFLHERTSGAKVVASVCTGAFVLARLGLLGDGPATTHWEDLRALREAYPSIEVLDGPAFAWVRGKQRVVSSAGVASGIAMSLALVVDLFGVDLAKRTARQIEFPFVDGVPNRAALGG